jgi:hypothetical protein
LSFILAIKELETLNGLPVTRTHPVSLSQHRLRTTRVEAKALQSTGSEMEDREKPEE